MPNLVDDYLRIAVEWGHAMSQGDSNVANDMNVRLQEKFSAILNSGLTQQLFLHAGSDDDAVSFVIASEIKRVDPSRAIAIYERLLTSSLPFVAVSAKYILKELRKA